MWRPSMKCLRSNGCGVGVGTGSIVVAVIGGIVAGSASPRTAAQSLVARDGLAPCTDRLKRLSAAGSRIG